MLPLLQVQVENSSEAGAAKADSLSMFDLVLSGGVIMIPIALLSVLAIYFIIERVLYINKSAKINNHSILSLKDKLKAGDVKGASDMCKMTNTAWGRVFGKGVNHLMAGGKIHDIEKTIEDAAQVEMSKMERNMGYLSLVAGAAPLLGFIGTIIGVIKIFYDISIAESITIRVISEGLYAKMITSAGGLVVGIIAFAGYQLLNTRIDRFAAKVQENALSFKSVLQNIEE